MVARPGLGWTAAVGRGVWALGKHLKCIAPRGRRFLARHQGRKASWGQPGVAGPGLWILHLARFTHLIKLVLETLEEIRLRRGEKEGVSADSSAPPAPPHPCSGPGPRMAPPSDPASWEILTQPSGFS